MSQIKGEGKPNEKPVKAAPIRLKKLVTRRIVIKRPSSS